MQNTVQLSTSVTVDVYRESDKAPRRSISIGNLHRNTYTVKRILLVTWLSGHTEKSFRFDLNRTRAIRTDLTVGPVVLYNDNVTRFDSCFKEFFIFLSTIRIARLEFKEDHDVIIALQ